MKNKKGAMSILVWVLLAVVVVGGGYYLYTNEGTAQSVAGTDPNECADSTGVLTVSAVSALEGASDPSSPTVTCGLNGDKVKTSVTSGTTTFAVGDKLDCLVSKADYIDKSFSATMKCGGLSEQVEMFYATSDNPSLTVKDPNNGDASVTDAIAGGASNLTNVDAGSTVDFEVEFKGTNTEATGDLIYVIEFPAGSNANITDVTMDGLKEVSIPTVHTSQNAGSKIVAFTVPNVEGAMKKEYSVIASLGTAKDLSGGVYTDWYSEQDFVDDDGYIASGVEDSDGTAKYENTGDYDFLISAS